MKKIYLFLILLLIPLVLFCSEEIDTLRNKIKNANPENKILLLAKLANLYTFSEQDSALLIFNEAMNLAQKRNDPKLLGIAYYENGYLYYRMGKMDSALANLKKSLKYKKKINDSSGIGIVLNRMGNVYWFLDKQLTAKECYESALKIHQVLKNNKEIGRAYNNLSNVYRSWGEYQKSINLFLKASEHYEKANYTEGLAWLNFSLALLYKKIEDYPNALNAINNSLVLYNRLATVNSDSNGIMICYGQLGDIYRLMGDYEKGLHYNLLALEMRKKSGVVAAIADGLMGVGQIYYEIGKYQESIEHMKESSSLRKEAKIRSGLDTNLKYLGYNYYKLGKINKSLNYLKQGLQVATGLNQLNSQRDILQMISQIYEENGNYKEAMHYFTQFDQIKGKLNQAELEKQLSILRLQTQIKEKQKENETLVLDNKIKILEIEQANALRNLLYMMIGFFVFIIIVVIYLYKKKLNDNLVLTSKNEEINKAHNLLEKEITERISIQKQREELIEELQESLSKIKTLRGLIPICASCKKIRNDKGYYEQVEEYIMQFTEVHFSHGICPECADKLYPGLINNENEDKKSNSVE